MIAAAVILLILRRPRRWPEAIWASAGALLFLLTGCISLPAGVTAVRRGTDVYLFLAGMMLLAELARQRGVFDWVAGLTARAAYGSPTRLFLYVYAAGILITVFLSNDATAVVLTPAVYAVVTRARARPMPYLFACAFVANAASFVLPISNPANLVVFGERLPPLLPWLRMFLAPSIGAVAATAAVLFAYSRGDLREPVEANPSVAALGSAGRRAAWGIVAAACVLVVASGFGLAPGLPTCLAALLAVGFSTGGAGVTNVFRGVAWSTIPLVAGLFVMVEALDRAGAYQLAASGLLRIGEMAPAAGMFAASTGIALLSNLINNLPSGLLTANALRDAVVTTPVRNALLVGIDLGPNLSVTGSLATILWLVALRREGIHVSAFRFLKAGALVTPPALALAVILLLV